MSGVAGSKTESVDVAKGAKVAIRLVPPRVAARPAPVATPKAEGQPPEPPGFFSPPDVVAPVYVAGAVGIVGFTAAIVLNGIRVNADRNASTATEALVRGNKDPAACGDAGATAADPTIAGACSTLRESDRITKQTNDPFTASLWIGVGATAAALAWYFIAPKPGAPSPTTGSLRGPVHVAPLVGPGGVGASVFGAF